MAASHVAFQLKNGHIPKKRDQASPRHPKHSIDFTCKNEACINWRHLVLGPGVGRKPLVGDERTVSRGVEFSALTLSALHFLQDDASATAGYPVSQREVIADAIERLSKCAFRVLNGDFHKEPSLDAVSRGVQFSKTTRAFIAEIQGAMLKRIGRRVSQREIVAAAILDNALARGIDQKRRSW